LYPARITTKEKPVNNSKTNKDLARTLLTSSSSDQDEQTHRGKPGKTKILTWMTQGG
jgi:hypothetical protein